MRWMRISYGALMALPDGYTDIIIEEINEEQKQRALHQQQAEFAARVR